MAGFALIGEKLGHSFSAEIYPLLGIDDYSLIEIAPQNLASFIKKKDFSGLNVTIPYKRAVMPYLDRIEDKAYQIGGVNCLINDQGRLIAYNTDYYGLKESLVESSLPFKNAKVLICGSGASSLTAKNVLKDLGASFLITVSRHPTPDKISYHDALKELDADYIINTSPLGMFPDLLGLYPLNPALFPKLKGVFDLVYNPLKSALLIEAEKNNIPAFSGLKMLILQAYFSYKLFKRKEDPFILNDNDKEICNSLYKKILGSKENIVLIGMPTSGKSSLGKIIAEKLKRPFFDMDLMIEERAGKKIYKIFADEGEEAFRNYENQLSEEMRTLQGSVIACGGGLVLNRANIDYLKANGYFVFLDRPLSKLYADPNRPTAYNDRALREIYHKRRDLYLSAADLVISDFSNEEKLIESIVKKYT